MSLQQSMDLVDRAMVTLLSDLPESLGFFNNAKDKLDLAALQSIPLLEKLTPVSRKHDFIKDWMKTYEPDSTGSLDESIQLDALRKQQKQERKKVEKEERSKRNEVLIKTPPVETKSKEAEQSKKKKSKDKEKRSKQRKTPSQQSSGKSKKLARDEDDRLLVEDAENDTWSSSSSESSSSESDSRDNLPPIESVLSSDEDDEPNDMFDEDDPDVYEVEEILEKQPGKFFGDKDMYLIKWKGYDETTWEPAENVPKDVIDEFESQPIREDEYVVEDILDRKTVRDKKTNLKNYKYKIKWLGYDETTWEPADNLPRSLRRKFDTKYESRKKRRRH